MGGEGTVLSAVEARHLLRRTGFGALPRDLDHILSLGQTRGEAVDHLLGLKPQVVRPNGHDFETAHAKWIRFLVKTKTPLHAKLALFWHDHFATSFVKVADICQGVPSGTGGVCP